MKLEIMQHITFSHFLNKEVLYHICSTPKNLSRFFHLISPEILLTWSKITMKFIQLYLSNSSPFSIDSFPSAHVAFSFIHPEVFQFDLVQSIKVSHKIFHVFRLPGFNRPGQVLYFLLQLRPLGFIFLLASLVSVYLLNIIQITLSSDVA